MTKKEIKEKEKFAQLFEGFTFQNYMVGSDGHIYEKKGANHSAHIDCWCQLEKI